MGVVHGSQNLSGTFTRRFVPVINDKIFTENSLDVTDVAGGDEMNTTFDA